jgi:hypothetical protein
MIAASGTFIQTPPISTSAQGAPRLLPMGHGGRHLEHNPASEVRYLSTATDGFQTWTIEFEARHPVGTKAWLAL